MLSKVIYALVNISAVNYVEPPLNIAGAETMGRFIAAWGGAYKGGQRKLASCFL